MKHLYMVAAVLNWVIGFIDIFSAGGDVSKMNHGFIFIILGWQLALLVEIRELRGD